MNDPKDEDDTVLVNHVEHEPVVADAETMEGVGSTPDGLHALALDPTRLCRAGGKPLECFPKSRPDRGRQLCVGALRGGREVNRVGLGQPRSSSVFVRPLR